MPSSLPMGSLMIFFLDLQSGDPNYQILQSLGGRIPIHSWISIIPDHTLVFMDKNCAFYPGWPKRGQKCWVEALNKNDFFVEFPGIISLLAIKITNIRVETIKTGIKCFTLKSSKKNKIFACPPTEPKTTLKIGKNGSTLQKMIFQVTGHRQHQPHQPKSA